MRRHTVIRLLVTSLSVAAPASPTVANLHAALDPSNSSLLNGGRSSKRSGREVMPSAPHRLYPSRIRPGAPPLRAATLEKGVVRWRSSWMSTITYPA
jgi:hypothetical protein